MTTWETLAREASDDKLRHYASGIGYAPAMREAARAELVRRETAGPVTPQADLAARWRPSEEQVAAAVAALEKAARVDPDARWLAAVPLAMPGKVHGIWEVGQVVECPPGVWVGVNQAGHTRQPSYANARNLACEAAERHLAGRAGTPGWAVVHADGHWAVFEDF